MAVTGWRRKGEIMHQPFNGNCPRSVGKDAKYSIKRDFSQGKWVVQLVYRLSHAEKALLATDDHPKLVGMVNDVKDDVVGQPGGAFYINEYCQVIVPALDAYYCAGKYDQLLTFDFEGDAISSRPPARLAPGDPWPGPHVGIPYVLSAGAKDIRFERRRGQRILTELLSLHTSGSQARKLANRLSRVKGSDGGRIYINEQREFFAPVIVADGLEYRYLGALGDDPWFSESFSD
jgi:hypothetical protein